MSPASRALLRRDVMTAEGLRLKPYLDSVGKWTVGYGRNLTDVGITALEAEVLLDHDLASAEMECRRAFPWFHSLTDARQRVLVDMCFNLGLPTLLEFKRMLAALAEDDYDGAAVEMLKSRWAAQVKSRAVRLAKVMRDGR
jgi:lysozyme